jgi:hypothetical protein
MALLTILLLLCCCEVFSQQAPTDFSAQYHIQTDLGDDRFFRFQTHTGQYRKEKVNPDGSVEGTYGWVDPNGILRLFEYVADSQGYRIEKESLYNVGAPSSSGVIATRGGDINLGFEVYPLDGSSVDRQSGGAAQRIHLADGEFSSTLPFQVSSLTSTNHHLSPNPLSKHAHATYFSGEPAAPPPRKIVVGAQAQALPAPQQEPESFVVGHTGLPRGRTQPEPVQRTGIVIGLSHNDDFQAARAPAQPAFQAARSQPAPRRLAPRQPAPSRSVIVIGSSRRRRFVRL